MSAHSILGAFRSHILYGPTDWRKESILRELAITGIEIPAPEILMLTEILNKLPIVDLYEEFPDMPDSWC